MKIFSENYFDTLIEQAKSSARLRQYRNIHLSYQEPCQRLFNAIEPDSYIRPHRHHSDPREELLTAVRGLMALVVFDDHGTITEIIPLGSEKFGTKIAQAVEIPSSVWHTVIALESACVLLEIKAGPFDPNQLKDFASWAPEENSASVADYQQELLTAVARYFKGHGIYRA